MKAQYTLTVPLMERAGQGNQNLNGTCVNGRSRELLLEIRELLDVFAPAGDDYRHSLWIEVPRGKPSDWASFRDMKCWDEDIKTRADYLKEWKDDCPRKSQWYNLSVSYHRGHTYLHMVESRHRYLNNCRRFRYPLYITSMSDSCPVIKMDKSCVVQIIIKHSFWHWTIY